MLFHPIGDGKFPEQKLARTGRERRVKNLTVFSIGPIETHLHAAAPVPRFLAIIIERELRRPTVVCLPGVIAALENEIGRSIVAHDEDDVALHATRECGELREINRSEEHTSELQSRFG